MKSNFSLIYTLALLVGDFLSVMLSFVIAYILRVSLDDRQLINEIPSSNYIKAFLLVIPIWLIIFYSIGLYNKSVYEKRLVELSKLAVGTFMGILVVIGFDFITEEPLFPARLVAVYALVWSFMLLALERQILWQVRKALFKKGWGISNVMLIGSTKATKQLAHLLAETDTSGYNIAGIVGSKSAIPKTFNGIHFSDVSEGLKSLGKLNIDTIIQTKLFEDNSKNRTILNAARSKHIAFRFVPAENQFYTGKSTIDLFHYFPVISVHQTALLGWGRIAKRIFDVMFSLIALILLSPLLIVVMILIKIEDQGPVFYKSKRMTRFGNETYIYKLRSLLQEYNGKDPVVVFNKMGKPELAEEYIKNRSKVKDDPRISKIGRFIRDTSIDEIPQLYNVLAGDISLVGPRSIPREELAKYEDEKHIVLSVKTGITGLAQVSGRSNLNMDERIELDMYYVQNWSFWMDVRIVLKTVFVVLNRGGSV